MEQTYLDIDEYIKENYEMLLQQVTEEYFSIKQEGGENV